MKVSLLSECEVMYVDHLAVTTPVFEETLAEYLSLGGARLLKGPGTNPEQKVRYAFVQLREGIAVEILSPAKDSPIARQVQQGGGPYHFCYAIADMEKAITAAQRMGAKLLVEPLADVAFDGRRVSFLFHQAHGVFEFVEAYPSSKGVSLPSTAREYPASVDVTALTVNDAGLDESEIEKNLRSVFLRVFTALEEADISSATMDDINGWDSLAQIQLVMELEATFSLNVPPARIEKLTSYQTILRYIKREAA